MKYNQQHPLFSFGAPVKTLPVLKLWISLSDCWGTFESKILCSLPWDPLGVGNAFPSSWIRFPHLNRQPRTKVSYSGSDPALPVWIFPRQSRVRVFWMSPWARPAGQPPVESPGCLCSPFQGTAQQQNSHSQTPARLLGDTKAPCLFAASGTLLGNPNWQGGWPHLAVTPFFCLPILPLGGKRGSGRDFFPPPSILFYFAHGRWC